MSENVPEEPNSILEDETMVSDLDVYVKRSFLKGERLLFWMTYCILMIKLNACVRSFSNGTNGMQMPSEVLPLATTGTNGMPMVTNGHQFFISLKLSVMIRFYWHDSK